MWNFWQNNKNFDIKFRNVRVILEKLLKNVKEIDIDLIKFRIFIENTRKFRKLSIKFFWYWVINHAYFQSSVPV